VCLLLTCLSPGLLIYIIWCVNLLVDVGVRERDRDVFCRGSTEAFMGWDALTGGSNPSNHVENASHYRRNHRRTSKAIS
jgi:hypothetical protein